MSDELAKLGGASGEHELVRLDLEHGGGPWRDRPATDERHVVGRDGLVLARLVSLQLLVLVL